MKTLYLASFALLVLTFYSCDKDSLSDDLIGDWQIYTIEHKNCSDPEDNTNGPVLYTDGCLDNAEVGTNCLTMSFSKDGTLTETTDAGSYMSTGIYTYTVDEEANEIVFCKVDNNQECYELEYIDNELVYKESQNGCESQANFRKI